MSQFPGDARDWRQRVDAAYSEDVERFYEERRHVVDDSLDPRGSSMFFDIAEELGLNAESHALDIGSRDARHIVEVATRFGCQVTGVEPAPGNLARMRRRWGELPLAVARGVAEALPFPDDTFDFVSVRDVLVHVPPLATAFAEIARVSARADAPVLVYHVLATELMEPGEAQRLWAHGAEVVENSDRVVFEGAIADAGLRIERREDIGSEWQEFGQELDGGPGRRLVRLARLLRRSEHYKALLGEDVYNVEVGDCRYGVYQMIGKLSPALYVLR